MSASKSAGSNRLCPLKRYDTWQKEIFNRKQSDPENRVEVEDSGSFVCLPDIYPEYEFLHIFPERLSLDSDPTPEFVIAAPKALLKSIESDFRRKLGPHNRYWSYVQCNQDRFHEMKTELASYVDVTTDKFPKTVLVVGTDDYMKRLRMYTCGGMRSFNECYNIMTGRAEKL